MRRILAASVFLVILCIGGLTVSAKGPTLIRVGYFPNITHAPAVIGIADGSFAQGMGKDVKIQSYQFNAGPSAMEALLAGQLDLVYVGPNPAANCYIKSEGQALRIIAGCCSGGAAMVVRADSNIRGDKDLRGKRIATPQLGNTQDVAFRSYLLAHSLKPRENGGDVQVLPTSNSNLLLLFERREIDGAWTVEPWVSRLIVEGGGRLFLDERDLWEGGRFTTAVLVVSTAFLHKYPELVRRWVDLHVGLCQKIKADPGWAKAAINRELERVVGKPLTEKVLDQAWSRLEITYDPLSATLRKATQQAYDLGFLGDKKPDLKNLYNLSYLQSVLKSRGLPPVK